MLIFHRKVNQGVVVRDENGKSWVALKILSVSGKRITIGLMGTHDREFARLNEDKDLPEELNADINEKSRGNDSY